LWGPKFNRRGKKGSADERGSTSNIRQWVRNRVTQGSLLEFKMEENKTKRSLQGKRFSEIVNLLPQNPDKQRYCIQKIDGPGK